MSPLLNLHSCVNSSLCLFKQSIQMCSCTLLTCHHVTVNTSGSYLKDMVCLHSCVKTILVMCAQHFYCTLRSFWTGSKLEVWASNKSGAGQSASPEEDLLAATALVFGVPVRLAQCGNALSRSGSPCKVQSRPGSFFKPASKAQDFTLLEVNPSSNARGTD